MNGKREIFGHTSHPLPGPYASLPADFVPLRLRLESASAPIELTRPIVMVGRHSDADLRLPHPEVSRRHCRISFADGQWRIYDLKSMNGISLNNVRVAEGTLYAGDRLRIGCMNLLVEAATPVRVSKAEKEKWRQIAEVLPVQEV